MTSDLPALSSADWAVLAASVILPVLASVVGGIFKQPESPAQFLTNSSSKNKDKSSPSPSSTSCLGKVFDVLLEESERIFLYSSVVLISGQTDEISRHGIQFLWTSYLSCILGFVLASVFLLPTLGKLRLNSIFEYLELRYRSYALRCLSSLAFSVTMLCHCALISSALGSFLTAVLGLNSLLMFFAVLSAFALLFTQMGVHRTALKVQGIHALILIISGLGILLIGLNRLSRLSPSDLDEILLQNGGRLNWFKLDPSPFLRSTTWSTFSGQLILWTAVFASHPQSRFQNRNNSGLSSHHSSQPENEGKMYSLLRLGIIFVLYGFSSFTAFVIYSVKQVQCHKNQNYFSSPADDDKESGIFSASRWIANDFVGDSGLGLYGLFAAFLMTLTLGSLISTVKAVCACLWEDLFSKTGLVRRLPLKGQLTLARLLKLVLILAVLTAAYFCPQTLGETDFLGSLYLILGITAGPLLVPYILGLFSDSSNKFGMIIAFATGTTLTTWLAVGKIFLSNPDSSKIFQNFVFAEDLKDECINPTNLTLATENAVQTSNFFYIPKNATWEGYFYEISWNLYPVIGFFVSLIIGLFASLIAKAVNEFKPVESSLLHPCIRLKSYKAKVKKADLGAGSNGDNGNNSIYSFGHQHRYLLQPGADFSKLSTTEPPRGFLAPSSIDIDEDHREDTLTSWQPDMSSHYRWPSPSLPPTLQRENQTGSSHHRKSSLRKSIGKAQMLKRNSSEESSSKKLDSFDNWHKTNDINNNSSNNSLVKHRLHHIGGKKVQNKAENNFRVLSRQNILTGLKTKNLKDNFETNSIVSSTWTADTNEKTDRTIFEDEEDEMENHSHISSTNF